MMSRVSGFHESTTFRKRLIRKDEEEGNEQRDVSDNECINEQRVSPCVCFGCLSDSPHFVCSLSPLSPAVRVEVIVDIFSSPSVCLALYFLVSENYDREHNSLQLFRIDCVESCKNNDNECINEQRAVCFGLDKILLFERALSAV